MKAIDCEDAVIVTAAEVKRPKTNLVPNTKFILPPELVKTGFMAVFGWKYSGDPRKTMFKLAFAPLMNMGGMSVKRSPKAVTQEDRANKRLKNKSISNWEEARQEQHLAQYVLLKKVNDGAKSHFLLDLPIVLVSGATHASAVIGLMDGDSLSEPAIDAFNRAVVLDEPESTETKVTDLVNPKDIPLKAVKNTAFKGQLAIRNAGLDPRTAETFATCLDSVQYRTTSGGGKTLISLRFVIPMKVAEFLVSTPWVEIRPVDLYPLFTMWVESEYVAKKYGKSAISMSKIASTLPAHNREDERVDQYNITVNMAGQPLWIPATCDNTEKYESQYTNAGNKPDQEFALRTMAGGPAPVLPINIPILVDWVNNKFTYSSTVGKPVVLDLAHMRKCTASMARNVMLRPTPDKWNVRLTNYARECKISELASDYGATPTMRRNRMNMTMSEFMGLALSMYKNANRVTEVRYIDIMSAPAPASQAAADTTADTFLMPVARFIKALATAMEQNIEAMYVKYAVSTMTEELGLLKLLASYGADVDKTLMQAKAETHAAINQGPAPDWTPPPCPLLTTKFSGDAGGLIPHQFKVRNIMRDRPNLAAWPIDAGGGKSMLTITDILYEIANGESAPYLILCPGHLIANYVSEIVEFTDGKVNVLPITSYNFHTTGIKRWEEILAKAPINTVLVIDYNTLKFRARATVYGTTVVNVYPVVELIRQYKPGYVMMDESHFLRNVGRARFKATMALVADIPKKRIASGTMNPDSPSDMPGQMAILDPTIFGSRQDFNEKYGEVIKGGRVLEWKQNGPNSVATVLTTLKDNVVWAPAKRKEWACALPQRRDRFLAVTLTPAQKVMYDAIFDEMIQQIKKKAETDASAAALLQKLQGKGTATEEDEEAFSDLGEKKSDDEKDLTGEGADDESSEEAEEELDIGAALKPFLVDIERFVTNPAWHPYAKNGFVNEAGIRIPPLTGNDLKAPKAVEMAKLLQEYLSTHEAKALVFANYTESVESLFAAMPPELQECGLLYRADNKTELVNKFQTDPKIRWMIGIRQSLEVGLNLQQAGYLLRVEGVWNPGEQEQGDSRIERPNFAVKVDPRGELLFDTLVADFTIDVTKAARLRAKMVDLAKFYNPNDPKYKAIPPIPVLAMNLENIQTRNSFDENLVEYQASMAALTRVVREENEEYKAKMIAEGGFHFTPVPQAPIPEGAALLSKVPYAQGTQLYKASELGLVRVDNFIGLELSNEEEEEGSDSDEDEEEFEESPDDAKKAAIRKQIDMVVGRRCHTESGEGYIIKASPAKSGAFIYKLQVRLDDGTVVRNLRVTNVFIVTRTETNSIDMRNKLAQAAGLEITAPITVPAFNNIQRKMSRKELEQQEERERQEREAKKKLKKGKGAPVTEEEEEAEDGEISVDDTLNIVLDMNVVNGYLRLSYRVGANKAASNALKALGFSLDPHYVYTRVRHLKHLKNQFKLWINAGFKMSKEADGDAFNALAEELQGGSLLTHRHYTRVVAAGTFRNYLKKEFKPSADKNVLTVFAMVVDDGATNAAAVKDAEAEGTPIPMATAYLCLPSGPGHPATKLATANNPKIKAPSSKWQPSEQTLSIFVSGLNGAKKAINSIMKAGIKISNVKDLQTMAAHVRKFQLKDDADVDISEAEEGSKPVKKAKK